MKFITDTLHQLGALNGALYLMSRALERLTRGRCRVIKYCFVAQPVADEPLVQARSDGVLDIVRVDASHPLVEAFPRPAQVIRDRYSQGAVCLSLLRKGEFAGFLWLVHERYDEDEVRCRFILQPAALAVWDFDVFVDARYRLGRGFARLWEAAYGYMRDHGVRWSISRISAFNPGSLRSHQRLGATCIGWALFLVAGSSQMMLSSRPPYVHLSANPANRPSITLQAPA